MKECKAEAYLEDIPLWSRKKNSLRDITMFLEELGSPQKGFKIIHVAGTNGKGSVCAFLTSSLKQSGIRVGTFTSPHLTDIKERFEIDGEMVSEDAFQNAFIRILELSEKMTEKGYCHPTYFEFLFLMAMVIFKEENTEYVILETGMGGRLDTTNVISRPEVCVITSVSLDHTQYLGDTIELIAAEKAGIIKPGVTVFYDDTDAAVSAVIEKYAKEKNAPAFPVNPGKNKIICSGSGSISVCFKDNENNDTELIVPFEAEYQAMNAVLAYYALNCLKNPLITKENIIAGIRTSRWPGRMEEILPGVFLDGAHNPGGISAFIKSASLIAGHRKKNIILLFAAAEDKNYEKMIYDICMGLKLKAVAAAHIDSSRGSSQEVIAEIFRKYVLCPVLSFKDTDAGFSYAMKEKTDDDLLFCVGSLYLTGEIKREAGRYMHD